MLTIFDNDSSAQPMPNVFTNLVCVMTVSTSVLQYFHLTMVDTQLLGNPCTVDSCVDGECVASSPEKTCGK